MDQPLRLPTKAQSAFLKQFQLEKRLLIQANRRQGSPALRAGIDGDGVPVLVKIWPKVTGRDDADLREMWRNEIRQLHRLAGHPSASDYIVELRIAHEDDLGFYVVLNPGDRQPLDKHFGDEDSSGRREIPRELRDRRMLWANIRRIASGLELLHSQGLLHRNLTTWSILTSGGSEADFQLTGFEWSMRLAASQEKSHAKKSRAFVASDDSFIRDWQDLGRVTAELLGVGEKINNREIANYDVSDSITADEAKLLRQLLQVIPTELVDGSFVMNRIDTVLCSVDALAQGKEPRFNLVLTLGQNSDLGRKVRAASDDEIEIDDVKSQKEFVEADLFSPVLISERKANRPGEFQLILRGQKLSYQLQDFLYGPEKTPSNWDAASCSKATVTIPLPQTIISSIPLSFQSLNVTTTVEVRKRTAQTRERFTSWGQLRNRLKPEAETTSKEKELRKSFALIQLLEYLFSAVELFPVKIVKQPPDNASDGKQYTLLLLPRPDDNRERLAQALGLKDSLAIRLKEALLDDRTDYEGSKIQNWRLTDTSILGGRSETTSEWKFQALVTAANGAIQFSFLGDQPPPNIDDAFLISEDFVGTHEQFLRRMRSFKALAEHGELTRMLLDPRSRMFHNDEKITEFPQFLELDSSKQGAFRAAIETVPLFLIQGPPGVGKTRLVKELVRYYISADNSSRILLSAQSNHAVDHLLHEIEEVGHVKNGTPPMIVRCQARERKDEHSPFDIGQQSKNLINSLIDSDIYKDASEHLRIQVDGLSDAYRSGTENWDSVAQTEKTSRKALEGLVLRAANLVFATTNSGDLGRLIEERAQFDWSIVEEAGKATGGELISPLLLSHRRLMIGDHKQLPPFGSEQILFMLERPKKVKEALELGESMIGRNFRDSAIDEIFSDVEANNANTNDQSFPNLCIQATKMFSLFETIVENEFERQEAKKIGRPIARALTAQHRMHPSIAKIVSNAFYDKKLITDLESEKKFATSESPVKSLDRGRLPESPVVWIDMPWVQNTMNMKVGEEQPRYVNDKELSAVEIVLQLLAGQATDKGAPSLAILSPYSRQVARLNKLVESDSKLKKALATFSKAAKQKTYCSTVDSFQGSEADCIIVSLVRNNHLGTLSAALGFLADQRRMNVLLSRARWKLIVIGSLDFLDSVIKLRMSPADAQRIEFLAKLFKDIRSDADLENVRVVRFDALRGANK